MPRDESKYLLSCSRDDCVAGVLIDYFHISSNYSMLVEESVEIGHHLLHLLQLADVALSCGEEFLHPDLRCFSLLSYNGQQFKHLIITINFSLVNQYF